MNMLEIASQLSQIDSDFLGKLEREVYDAGVNWLTPFHEYTSDGASIVTLWNASGEDIDFIYPDTLETSKTPQLKRLPVLDEFLSQSGLQIISSYISFLSPGTFLHEHRDFVLQTLSRVRLHIPIVTHDLAFLIVPGKKIHFKKGYIWKFDPRNNLHSAFNAGVSERIHLLIDCYPNEKTNELLANEWLEPSLVGQLPIFSEENKKELLQKAKQELQNSNRKKAEEILLASFCQYDLHGLTSYDLLLELYSEDSKFEERLNYWRKHKEEEVLLELA